MVEKNPDVRFVLFGWGDQKQFLHDLLHRSHLAHHVFLIEGVYDAARYLKAFDIFALPSLKEGLPYVLLEAKLAGVPIVATAVGGVPEIVDEATGILVLPARPDLFAEAILSLHDSPLLTINKNFSNNDTHSAPVRTLEEMLADTMRCYE